MYFRFFFRRRTASVFVTVLATALLVAIFAGCQSETTETNHGAVQENSENSNPAGEQVATNDPETDRSTGNSAPPQKDVSQDVARLKQQYEDFTKTASPVNGRELAPEVEQVTEQMLQLAVDNPAAKGAFEALEFVTNIHSVGPKLTRAYAELQKHHLLNQAIGDICMKHSFNCGPGIDELMRSVEQTATDRTVLAKTIYARSRLYYFSKNTRQQFERGGPAIEEMKKLLPAETLNHIMNFQPRDEESRQLLQKLIDDYADIEIDGQSMKNVASDAMKFLVEGG